MIIVGELLTVEEVSERIKVIKDTVREWLRNGDLVGIKLGKAWRIEEQDLIDFLEDRKNNN